MTNTSLTDIALMLMVNVLFISNYFFIRKLRIIMNSNTGDTTTLDNLRRNVADTKLFKGFRRFVAGYQSTSSNNKAGKGKLKEIMYAGCLGKHRMEPAIGKRFPEWRPIPFRLGIISTALALLIATVLLSDNGLKSKLAVSQGGRSGGFCSTDDFDEKIMTFRDHIKGQNVTNYYNAKRQSNVTLLFRDTLDSESVQNWNRACDRQFDANQREEIKKKCTFKQKVCVDDWGWSVLCKTVEVTLPSCVAALEGAAVEDPEIDPNIESDADASALDHLNQRSAALVQKLLRQIDIAGTLYSFYLVVTLFFPTPILLFRPPMSVRTKQLLCGVQKYTFMVTVLIIYWGYEHFFRLLAIPEVKIFFKNLATDPCFLDGDFISNRTDVVRETCEELIIMENTLGLVDAKVNGTLDVMDQCTIGFPSCDDLKVPDDMNRDEYGINKSFSKCQDIYAPSSHFIGNETICINREYSRNEILVADDTGLNFWELWIRSGLLATLLVKFSIANFGVALLRLADPFSACDGEYESPPEVMNADLAEAGSETRALLHVDITMRDNKIAGLKTVALRECLVWGLFTNMSLVCLILASSSRLESFKTLDYVVFTIIICMSVGASFCCFVFTKLSARIVDEIAANSDDEEKPKGLSDLFSRRT